MPVLTTHSKDLSGYSFNPKIPSHLLPYQDPDYRHPEITQFPNSSKPINPYYNSKRSMWTNESITVPRYGIPGKQKTVLPKPNLVLIDVDGVVLNGHYYHEETALKLAGLLGVNHHSHQSENHQVSLDHLRTRRGKGEDPWHVIKQKIIRDQRLRPILEVLLMKSVKELHPETFSRLSSTASRETLRTFARYYKSNDPNTGRSYLSNLATSIVEALFSPLNTDYNLSDSLGVSYRFTRIESTRTILKALQKDPKGLAEFYDDLIHEMLRVVEVHEQGTSSLRDIKIDRADNALYWLGHYVSPYIIANTNRDQEYAEAALQGTPLKGIVGRNSSESQPRRPKPAPDIFVYTLPLCINTLPKDPVIWMIGDQTSDMEYLRTIKTYMKALSYEVQTFGIGILPPGHENNGALRNSLKSSGADIVYPDLYQLALEISIALHGHGIE